MSKNLATGGRHQWKVWVLMSADGLRFTLFPSSRFVTVFNEGRQTLAGAMGERLCAF